MAAPSIPNLLSLRGARGSARGNRGRGGGRSGGGGPPSRTHDQIIQSTDSDASVSRLSAVSLGYLNDPFASALASTYEPVRRLPIINRGTYTRTRALDQLVEGFLHVDTPRGDGDVDGQVRRKQIVSLGAGADSRPFRLFADPRVSDLIYHEIDFAESCAAKHGLTRRNPTLGAVFKHPQSHEDQNWTASSDRNNEYRGHAYDLRHLAQPGGTKPQFELDIPTLLISECCLCYLQVAEAEAVVKWFMERIPNLGIVLYEPIHPDDAFGRTMTSNLAARYIFMPTLQVYRSPEDQQKRLKEAGFAHTKQLTMDKIWQQWIPRAEKERLDALEGLDEVEEWNLLASHYIVAWAWKGDGFDMWQE